MNTNTDMEPFTIEVSAGDTPYEESTVKSVTRYGDDGDWSVTMENGWSVLVPALKIEVHGRVLREPVEPKVGDYIALYGRGIGYGIEGIVVNDTVVYYRDEKMREAHRRRWIEDLDARRDREFIVLKEEMDKEYAALPPILQARIARFRDENPDFRRESERYEVFCCTEAVKIAEHCKAQRPDDPRGFYTEMVTQTSPSGSIDPCWGQLTEAGIVSDGHSNNTFAGALRLADGMLRVEAGEEITL